jgi:hypothetical protein
MKKILLVLPIIFVVLACGPVAAQTQPPQDISAIVNATLTAVSEQNPTVVTQPTQPAAADSNNSSASPQLIAPTPDAVQVSPGMVIRPTDPNATPGRDYFPGMGTITGSLSYPSSFIPPMRVAAFSLADGSVSYTDTAKNQGTYAINVPVGTYHVVAYPYDSSAPASVGSASTYGGGYTQAVPCGLNIACTDHTLISITVTENQTVNADPGDWYAPEGSFPPMPGEFGTITGQLSYPSSFIPPMRVVFFNQNTGQVSYVDTAKNQGTYSIGLPAGIYTVVSYAYDAASYTTPAPGALTFAGGYTQSVLCGLTVACTDHTLIQVTVSVGSTITANPGDWYAPEGTFPPMPNP